MMDVSVQLDDLKFLDEVLKSNCDRVRFGPEFCEWKIPSLNELKNTFHLSEKNDKEFTYVTPRVSNSSLKKLHSHFTYMNDQRETNVVVNDLGVLDQVEHFFNLKPYLGRQLITVLGRCPWKQITEFKTTSWLKNRKVSKTFYQTRLNYELTIQSFKEHGVQGADVDWIPQCFPYYDFLVENVLNLAVHLHLIPTTVTRRCHTARFLGEKIIERCSKPCDTKAFRLRQEMMDLNLYLHGNTVFSLTEHSQKDINRLYKRKVSEFIITMNPLTKITHKKEIDDLIQKFN